VAIQLGRHAGFAGLAMTKLPFTLRLRIHDPHRGSAEGAKRGKPLPYSTLSLLRVSAIGPMPRCWIYWHSWAELGHQILHRMKFKDFAAAEILLG
jgi:hypothetical protein